jgi:hypothetical protein
MKNNLQTGRQNNDEKIQSLSRTKYGKVETRRELLERLKNDRNEFNKIKEMKNTIESKNKNEFHFGYYSVEKNMLKIKKIKIDELNKKLKLVDFEIKRSEKKIEDVQMNLKETFTKEEMVEYLEKLKIKRKELIEMIKSRT